MLFIVSYSNENLLAFDFFEFNLNIYVTSCYYVNKYYDKLK